MSMTHASWLEIDLARLDGNLSAWQDFLAGDRVQSVSPDGPRESSGGVELADETAAAAGRSGGIEPQVGVCAVLKADGYGLGAVALAHRLAGRGIQMIAVYSPEQARDLAAGGLNCPLLLLMPVRDLGRADPLYRLAVAKRLHLTAHDCGQIQDLSRLSRKLGLALPVQLYVDTGMSRAGLQPEDLPRAVSMIQEARNLYLTGIYSHFSSPQSSWEATWEENERFLQSLAMVNDQIDADQVQIHAAGTFGALRDRAFHHQMVRLGLGLFGYGPELMEGENRVEITPVLAPILRWVSHVVHIQRYPAGATVGYDRTLTLERESVLGVVPVGYADGYPLALSGRGVVEVSRDLQQEEPAEVPVLGRINMDQIVVDLTEVPGVEIGCRVNVISNRPGSAASLANLATAAGTNCYELLCRLSTRLARIYVRTEAAQPMPMRLKRFDTTAPRVPATGT